MVRRTEKRIKAEKIARQNNIELSADLYKELEDIGYFWDVPKKEWEHGGDPNAPMQIIQIRVMTDIDKVQGDTNRLVRYLTACGYEVLKRSKTYRNRPPDHNDGRIYLELSRSWEKKFNSENQ